MKITKENYEAYYLDALEGNLSAEVLALFHAFLEEYPELAVDLEDFPVLEPNISRELPPDFLGALKHIDFDNEQITDNNAEQFCIAHSEGLLTDEKKVELQQFVQKNESWVMVFDMYRHVHLQPRSSEVYPNPQKLKRSERRLLPLLYSVGAAAALVIAFLMYHFNGSEARKSSGPAFANQQKDTTKKKKRNIEEQPQQAELRTQFIRTPFVTQRKEKELRVYDVNPFESSDIHSPAPMLSQQKMENTPKDDSLATAYVPQHSPSITHSVPTRVNIPTDQGKDLVNPIFPVTNALSAMLNTEIDFGKTRNTAAENRGFYVKIGKFEISRNTRR
jgi:hypothetical protein